MHTEIIITFVLFVASAAPKNAFETFKIFIRKETFESCIYEF